MKDITKELYNLRLNETIDHASKDNSTLAVTITRVPGGWIYSVYDKFHSIGSSCFVPFNNEYLGGEG